MTEPKDKCAHGPDCKVHDWETMFRKARVEARDEMLAFGKDLQAKARENGAEVPSGTSCNATWMFHEIVHLKLAVSALLNKEVERIEAQKHMTEIFEKAMAQMETLTKDGKKMTEH